MLKHTAGGEAEVFLRCKCQPGTTIYSHFIRREKKRYIDNVQGEKNAMI